MVSNFKNGNINSKGQDHKNYTIVKGMKTFNSCHKSLSPAVVQLNTCVCSLEAKNAQKIRTESANFMDQTSLFIHIGLISVPLMVSKFNNGIHGSFKS